MPSYSSTDEANTPSVSRLTISSSLASDYAIRINQPICTAKNQHGNGIYKMTWDFHQLANWQDSMLGTTEQLDIHALNACSQLQFDSQTAVKASLSCTMEGPYDNQWYVEVDASQTKEMPKDLVCVMSRIIVQSAASYIASVGHEELGPSPLIHLTLPTVPGQTFQEFHLSQLLQPTNNNDCNHIGIRQLFTPVNADYASMEIVDMVDNNGQILGSCPRQWVHILNILHRGIGMIVSKDKSILDPNSAKLPQVYVHQRTDTKRIFPSLYDMFVGGISSRGESAKLTAAREITEELGLKSALQYQQSPTEAFNPLSDELFQCTICTAYNRCVVSMFAYQCLTDAESIRWQEEEVQWGEFVPYEIVEVAGALSIGRLVEDGSWTGGVVDCGVGRDQLEEKVSGLKNEYGSHLSWDTWDFVPDGLLVWQAWLSWFQDK
jgi:8-oxo-dGTP pyrophosphatase MutT (NUDIX family)